MTDTTTTPPHAHGDQAPKNDFRALLAHAQAHPWTYIGAAGFVVLVLIVTGIYRLSQKATMESAATELTRALDIEDAPARAAALSAIAESASPLAARALYLQGESELEAANYEGAQKAFTALRESYPDYEFVPEAVEGLALIQEDAGNFAQARGIYEEVAAKWPDSVAAQRQPFNIARCFEGEKDFAKAIEKYRNQLEVFPGSTIAVRAQQRLDELRAERPELFPADAAIDTLQPAPTAAAPETETTPDAETQEPQPAPETVAPAAPEAAPAPPANP